MCGSHPHFASRSGHGPRFRGRLSAACVWLLAIVADSGCSKDHIVTPRDTATVSGPVRLTGALRDEAGNYLGILILEGATGIKVTLIRDGLVHGEGTTTGGLYHFGGLPPATYQVVAPVIGTIADTTRPIVVSSNRDTTIAERLELDSTGLMSFPIPFTASVRIQFEITTPGTVTLEVITLSGVLVATPLAQSLPAGVHQVIWNGLDESGVAVPAGTYWVTFHQGDDYRAELIFKE